MPIEVVSVRVSDHPHQEIDTAGIVRQSERMKEVEGGRRASGNCAIEEEMNKQISLETEQMRKIERSIRSFDKERMTLMFNSTILQGDCHFVEKAFSFEPRRINNDQSQRSSIDQSEK